MSVQFCLALLLLSSLTAASDPECEELLKPLDNQRQAYGKWIYYVGTSDNKEQLQELQSLNSSWIELSPVPDSDEMALRWRDRGVDGKCDYGGVHYTISGTSTKATFHTNSTTSEHIGNHLVTCPDCITWVDTSVMQGKDRETRTGRNLYLFTKSGTAEESHLEMFKKQAACLNFPPEFHFGQVTDLCPDVDAKEEEQ